MEKIDRALEDHNEFARRAAPLHKRIVELEAALHLIEDKYTAIMGDPPEWVSMTERELAIAREAWSGAASIARKALGK